MRRLRGWFEYSTDLFDAATIERMAAHLQTLLEAIVANPEAANLSAASAAGGRTQAGSRRLERHRDQISPAGTFFDRFARQVERAPDAIGSVRQPGSAQLPRARASELGHRRPARREGVGRDVIVILLAERGVDLLAGDDRGAAGRGSVSSPGPERFPPPGWPKSFSTAARAGPGRARLRRGCFKRRCRDIPARVRPQVLSLAELIQATPRTRQLPDGPAGARRVWPT